MKLISTLTSILVTSVLLSACASTSEIEFSSAFTFEFEGNQYEILGHTVSNDEDTGSNDLIKRQNGRVVLWFRDMNQNGILTNAIIGDLPLEEANRIYQAGINLAIEKDRLKEREYDRRYQVTDGRYHYEIISAWIESPETYNLFIVTNINTEVSFQIRDMGRNGMLDDPDFSELANASYQEDYTNILLRGVEEGRIEFDGETYTVKRKRELSML